LELHLKALVTNQEKKWRYWTFLFNLNILNFIDFY
jgi:hypothetical protein